MYPNQNQPLSFYDLPRLSDLAMPCRGMLGRACADLATSRAASARQHQALSAGLRVELNPSSWGHWP